MAFSWLYKEKVKGLLQLEKFMIYVKAYYFLKTKCDNSVYLCVRGLSLITSDQKMKAFEKF